MKSNHVSTKVPFFSKEHIEYLNSIYPENTVVLPEENMYFRTGQRSVVQHIEYLVEQARKKSQEILQ